MDKTCNRINSLLQNNQRLSDGTIIQSINIFYPNSEKKIKKINYGEFKVNHHLGVISVRDDVLLLILRRYYDSVLNLIPIGFHSK